jgi:hypothetical protein
VKIQPDETDLLGSWITRDGRVVADGVSKRIQFLTESYLQKISGGGWETLYQDPADGRYWELTYPQSHLHGGGPPRLINLSEQQARAKYAF